jgi:hypothetical protein
MLFFKVSSFGFMCTNFVCFDVHYSGVPCEIPYDDGYIYGFFSQDNVKVGDIIIKDQVSICLF